MKRFLFVGKIIATVLFAVVCLQGCGKLSYYSQSVVGHSKLMLARQPIDKAIAQSDGEIKRQLQLAVALRRFAVDTLALPDNRSYLSYVPLERDYPVWSVVAAPEFSLKPQRWCYPVIGCAAYRGYFSKSAAERYAQGLREQGFETEVGGAIAYSTLGWFNDPLIPPMLRHGDAYLAQIMFHELAHQQLYVNGNSAFNEAFATVVGEQGALLWLQQYQPDKVSEYQQLMQVRNDFSALVKTTKQRLQTVYASAQIDEHKRLEKAQVLAQMKTEHSVLQTQRWQGKAWYNSWFKQPVNNARLASFATYRDLVPQFEALFLACEQDFSRFYQTVALQKRQAKAAIVATQCVNDPIE